MGDVFYGSYSQLSTYAECARRYELEKIERVPRRPGFWFPGGTAVHATIEAYLREAVKCSAASPAVKSSSPTTTGNSSTSTDTTGANPEPTETPTRSLLEEATGLTVDELFQQELHVAYEAELAHTTFPPEEWFTAGRGKGEDLPWWMENGSQFVQNFIDWYEASPDIHVWVAPDGRPAIELDLTVQFGAVPVRMVIDLVLQVGAGANAPLIVTDLKSGSTKPKSPRQLAIYASGIEKKWGVRPRYGSYFMCRGTGKEETIYFQQPVELSAPQYSHEYLSNEFRQFDLGTDRGVFLATPGDNCRRCGVAYACTEVGGDQARRLDPNHPFHIRSAR